MADFETNVQEEDCRVWGWGLCDIEKAKTLWDVEIGGSIDDFIKRVSQVDSNTYFHNLGFDGIFIIYRLFKLGYQHTTHQYPRKGEFSTLISNMGAFYSISVTWMNGKRTEFRDSYKKLPMSVAAVAESYKMDMAKGDLDYETNRPIGHVPTPKERYYIGTDVLIVSRALQIQLAEGATRLTVGSDALNEYKSIVKSKVFRTKFPVLSDAIDREIRGAYRGGFTYVAERFKGKRLKRPGKVYDVNSLYPFIMYDRLLPYGEPCYVEGAPEPNEQYPLYIANITFTATLKPNHIPVIQVKGSHRFTATEYQTEILDPIQMMVSSVDLALWEKHYDLEIHAYDGAWMFRAETGMFNQYIDKWMEVKKTSEGGRRALAKLFLNALYGKFATNPDITGKYPILDPETDAVKLVTGDPETRDPIYTAMGVFITAYARSMTISAAQANYDIFAYCDTDSLHLLTDQHPEDLYIDKDELGAWKHEYDFTEALFVRAKTYIEKKAWKGVPFIVQHETHIAGLPVKVAKKLTMETLVPGARFAGKLVPKRVPGGIVLTDVGFTVPVW
jgi:hypothetical protein